MLDVTPNNSVTSLTYASLQGVCLPVSCFYYHLHMDISKPLQKARMKKKVPTVIQLSATFDHPISKNPQNHHSSYMVSCCPLEYCYTFLLYTYTHMHIYMHTHAHTHHRGVPEYSPLRGMKQGPFK